MGAEPELRLSVTDRFEPRTERGFVERVVRAVLDFAGEPQREVSLLLTDDREIARIHGEFLDDPTPTDVISFDLGDTIDLVVNVQRAQERASELGHEVGAEIALYIVHGVLHAFGYDDHEANDRARMRVAEREVLSRLDQRVTPVDDEHDDTRA
ncbi:MAG: rRNA maturation RNase YbeY [Planctomycetes bacterium]|nr:rRNA maturation RNase YbeY [Planctomycetota bacterium]